MDYHSVKQPYSTSDITKLNHPLLYTNLKPVEGSPAKCHGRVMKRYRELGCNNTVSYELEEPKRNQIINL